MKQFVVVSLYLAILIGAFNTYRWLLMAEYHVGYFVYGYTLIEALVLAKVIIVGESLGIGERFSNKPLIFPTLYKTLLFALCVLAFGILEHLIKGFLHGHDLAEVFQAIIRTVRDPRSHSDNVRGLNPVLCLSRGRASAERGKPV